MTSYYGQSQLLLCNKGEGGGVVAVRGNKPGRFGAEEADESIYLLGGTTIAGQ
jgi:hypothetical protein